MIVMRRPLVITTMMTMVLLPLCGAVPTTPPHSQEDRSKAQAYLSTYYSGVGISAPSSIRRVSVGSFETSLRKMQEFFGLEVTGSLDANTLEVMARPRCGVTDLARFVHFGGKPRWEQSVVTYRITEYTPDLSRDEVDGTIAKAFKLYSDVTNLDFKQIDSGIADIIILFKGGHHGDFHPFDGPSGVLAHASSPGEGQGGDTHFDDDEQWTRTDIGVNLLLVAAHEFGHALGLDHSQDETALMYPIYQYVSTQGYELPDDDKRGVQALYGVRTTPNPPDPNPDPKPQPKPEPEPRPEPQPDPKPEPEPEPEPRPEPPERCNRDLVFDAATSVRDELYFFKNGYFWKKSGYWDGIMTREVKSVWPGINSVDAAYEYKNRDIAFLFEGDHYWGIRGNTALAGYPKRLTNFGLPGSVEKIDAAIHVSFTGRTLFFVKNRYWSFNERRGQMDRGYPRYIYKDFPGIGYKVDAAFENSGYMYFSNGARQTEYYFPRKRVHRVLLNYGWLDCY